MNHLVFLDTRAMELEKILSGVKTMVAKDFEPDPSVGSPVRPGDSLYFLRNKDDCDLRVKATVVRVLPLINCLDEELSHTLKEMQSRLQLTEEQFSCWSAKKRVLLVEFYSARKIDVVHVALDKITDQSKWIAFDAFGFIT
jgi:hypothetical protein